MGVVGVCSLYIVWISTNLNYYKSFILIILIGISVSESEFLSSMSWLSTASTFQSPSASKLSNPTLPQPIIIWVILYGFHNDDFYNFKNKKEVASIKLWRKWIDYSITNQLYRNLTIILGAHLLALHMIGSNALSSTVMMKKMQHKSSKIMIQC